MQRRVGGIVVFGILIAFAIAWLRTGAIDRAPEPPMPSAKPIGKPPAPSAPPPTATAANDPRADPPDPPEIAATRKVAALHGYGTIHCRFPAPFPDPPGGPFHYATWRGNVMTVAVSTPEGRGPVWIEGDEEADPPDGILSWRDAWPGETGQCAFEPIREVTITLALADPDGAPMADAALSLCDRTVTTDASGRAEVDLWAGDQCWIKLGTPVLRDGRMVGPAVTDGPPPTRSSLPLRVPDVDATVALVGYEDFEQPLLSGADLREALAEEAPAGIHPLQALLDQPDLPADERAVLSAWWDEERAAAHARAAALEAIGAPPP